MLHAQPPGHQLVTATICNGSLNVTEIQCNHQITTTLVRQCHYTYYVCALISAHRKTSTFNLTRQTGNSTTVFRRVQSFEAQRRHRRTGMGQSHRKFTHSNRQSTQFYCSVLGCLKIQKSFGETDTVLTRDLLFQYILPVMVSSLPKSS